MMTFSCCEFMGKYGRALFHVNDKGWACLLGRFGPSGEAIYVNYCPFCSGKFKGPEWDIVRLRGRDGEIFDPPLRCDGPFETHAKAEEQLVRISENDGVLADWAVVISEEGKYQ